MSERVVLAAIVLIAASGLPGLLFGRHSTVGPLVAVVLGVAGSLLGILGALAAAIFGDCEPILAEWPVPGGAFAVAVDGIAAVFLLPIFLIPMLGGIYGLGYWRPHEHPDTARKLRFFYGLVAASVALVIIARNAVLFLVAWEVMAIAAFFLVTTEDHEEPVRAVGFVYLVATHVATVCLFGMFAVLASGSGSLAIAPLTEGELSPGRATGVFVLALAGFGIKAGLMPLHVWLPGAHAMAPSHVSALLSGVLIKVGIYGLVRIFSLFPTPPAWWGALVLALGAFSGVFGVTFAIGQHDLKRLLAYHSVENIGIICLGIGLAMIGRSLGRADWVALGLAGGLLHVWNHGLFKSLLFLSAGSVIHAVGTREIDHLGGLAKSMPRTAVCFAIGAVAICGLPPLNGFVSELLIYIGLFRTLGIPDTPSWSAAAFAVPALALIGALAVSCFVKAFGAVFLGTARSAHADRAHDCGIAMWLPMSVLVACCVVIGLAPGLVAPIMDRAIAAWYPIAPEPGELVRLASQAPFRSISAVAIALISSVVVVAVLLRRFSHARHTVTARTWDCGYAAPSGTMQYTSSSFAASLVRLFSWILRPNLRVTRGGELFPRAGRFESNVPDAMLDSVIVPVFRRVAWLLSWFRVLQQGSIQLYLSYIFAAVVGLFIWTYWRFSGR